MPKVVTVYGTRFSAIDVVPAIPTLQAVSRFVSVVVSTNPQRKMLDQGNKRFGIETNYDLGLMLLEQRTAGECV